MNCPNCKKPVTTDSTTCEWCGTICSNQDNAKSISENNKYNINIINFQRKNQQFLFPVTIQVFIDGYMVSEINSGENITCSVSEGVHSIMLKLNSLTTRRTAFDITVKQDSTVIVKLNRITGKIDVKLSDNSYSIKIHE